MLISLDTECTGIDVYHGARPYLVTTASDDCYGGTTPDGVQLFWEWAVDPLTREPIIPPGDVEEIQELIDRADEVATQNGRFDVAMLAAVGIRLPWEKLWDTLLAGHLLSSNTSHDLYSMASHYLRVNLQHFEDEMKEAVLACRTICRSEFAGKVTRVRRNSVEQQPTWRIAAEGLPEMPSVKGGSKKGAKGVESESPWKADCWLPRTMAREKGLPPGHPWWTVTSRYANADSDVTLPLRRKMGELIRVGGWEKVLRLGRSPLPEIATEMEERGVTVNRDELERLRTRYTEEVERAEALCLGVAEDLGAELELPRGSSNESLTRFIFGRELVKEKQPDGKVLVSLGDRCPGLGLEPIKRTPSGAPSYDQDVLEEWEKRLEAGSLEQQFVEALRGRSSRRTSVTYLDGYERFWLPLLDPRERSRLPSDLYDDREWERWFRLHPQVNPTGTDTLRWSSSNPNSQNVSKDESECLYCAGNGCGHCEGTGIAIWSLRRCFGPAPGREWWSADAQNIELRIPAYEACEVEVVRVFDEPKRPPYFGSYHLVVFDALHPELFARDGAECKTIYESTWYQWVKNGNFARQYGAQERKADATYRVDGAYRRLAERFPRIDLLNRQYLNQANRLGYVETIPDKTVDSERGYPILCSRSESGGIIPTTPFCYHVSGTACWWIGKAQIRCKGQLDEWRRGGFDAFMTMQVHDEIVFDMPKAAHPKKDPKRSNLGRVRELRRLMEMGGDDIGVPTPVSFEYHETSWAKGVKV